MSNGNNNRISGIALTMLLRRPDLTSSVSEDNCFETQPFFKIQEKKQKQLIYFKLAYWSQIFEISKNFRNTIDKLSLPPDHYNYHHVRY